jgi:hypothetical protein
MKVKVQNPHNIVRVTVPLKTPIEVSHGATPFCLQDSQGNSLQTQCQVVSLSPDNEKADIVELIAYDPRGNNSNYDVIPSP